MTVRHLMQPDTLSLTKFLFAVFGFHSLALWYHHWAHQQSCGTLSRVSTEMGDHLWLYLLRF